ncbi:reverse transcriptase domain-containing protein [Tanacetum coccineum]|uniref:Reverse transcriptase domain-containing protein n=1 Tax=Tanacetum coccineum TaxID=301880 RepID=A0ABQ5GK46_9ASTR
MTPGEGDKGRQIASANNGSTEDVQPPVVQIQSRNPNPEPNVAPVLYRCLDAMPKFSSTLKTLIGNKEKLSELARTPLNENCSAVILNKLPKKLGDPGRFLIPCEFTGITTCNALADLGASINLMPYSVWNNLSLPELTPTCMTLELADRSITKPIGIAEDVFVNVGKFQFPADFVVVDFEPDPRVPLILGRCFLKTSHALIDVYEGEITLRVGKEAITFNLDQTSRYTADYNHMTVNKIDVIDMACDEYSRGPRIFKRDRDDFLLFEEADSFLALEDDPTSSEVDPTYQDPEGDILLLEAILNSEPPPPSQIKNNICLELGKNSNSVKIKPLNLPLMNLPSGEQSLGQRKNKHFQPIHYASKTMNEAQTHYTTTEKELLAVVYAFEKFRSYLVMSKSIVYTDHSAIKYLFAKKDAKARLMRWILLLQEFDIEIRDKKGAENLAADHLSRLENPHQDKSGNKEINEAFPLETLGSIALKDDSTPWFADFANYHAGKFIVKGMSSQQKNKFFKDVKHYFWDDPFLFKNCADRRYHTYVFRGKEALDILKESIGPPSTRDAPRLLSTRCDIVNVKAKIRNVIKMPQKLQPRFCESVDIWGIEIYGVVPDFRGNKYILLAE